MQTFLLSSTLCDEVDKLCRQFIWGYHGSSRKLVLVPWEQVQRLKNCSSLGFSSTRLTNLAFMIKLAWGIVSESDTLGSDSGSLVKG